MAEDINPDKDKDLMKGNYNHLIKPVNTYVHNL